MTPARANEVVSNLLTSEIKNHRADLILADIDPSEAPTARYIPDRGDAPGFGTLHVSQGLKAPPRRFNSGVALRFPPQSIGRRS